MSTVAAQDISNVLIDKYCVVQTPLAAIKPHPKNPRVHSKKQVKQIAASIKAFGFNVPLLLDHAGGLLAGHGRLLAAKQLGYPTVPTISLAHLSREQARAFMIADNRLTENADWDDTVLAEHFEDLQSLALEFEITDTGFESPHIDFLIESRRRLRAGPSDEPQFPATGPLVTLPGDLWLLGDHRLLCGDARSPTDYDALLDGYQAGMVFADPPWNCPITGHVSGNGRVRHREFAMASGEMSKVEFTTFLQTICSLMSRASRDGAIHYVCIDFRHLRELLDASEGLYSEVKNMCIWVKDNGGMGSLYRSQHELVFVFKKGTAPHINNIELGKHGRNRTNVWCYPGANSFSRDTAEGKLLELHPTVKPVDLVSDAMLDCSNRGDIVLDPFVGSGTTLLAAERTGRIAYCMEIDPSYVDTAVRRWQNVTGKAARHARSGLHFDEVVRAREEDTHADA